MQVFDSLAVPFIYELPYLPTNWHSSLTEELPRYFDHKSKLSHIFRIVTELTFSAGVTLFMP